MPLFNKRPNPDAVLIELLKIIAPSIPADQVTDELSKHPDYPNLLALSDVLSNFGVESGAYKIGKEDLPEVPVPFIAHTSKAGTEFLLVTALTPEKVTVTDQHTKNRVLGYAEFTEIFNGIVLAAEAPLLAEKPDEKFSLSDAFRQKLALVLLAFVLVAVIGLHYQVFSSWHIILAALFKTAGVAVSILLLLQSIDKNNPLVQSICGGSGKTNCNAILTSKAANVFEGLSWSEVGFFYFTGTWLALIFESNISVLQVLAILNILSLPYTVYSIYHQWRVAKQWCVLCCTVQALLWLEFIPLVSFLNLPYQLVGWTDVIGLLICFALPAAVWLMLKPLMLKAKQADELKQQLRKFKYSSQSFNILLKNQPKFAQPSPDWSIVLGNVEAGNIITMVSNPYCPPCAKTHNILDNWLNSNPDIQLRLVFTASNNDNDFKTPVTRHLMALNELPDKAIVKAALHDWYEQKHKSYEAWAAEHPVILDETKFYKLEKQEEWCNLAEVRATPTLLVNGYRLPEVYQIQDIKYLLA